VEAVDDGHFAVAVAIVEKVTDAVACMDHAQMLTVHCDGLLLLLQHLHLD
jgi:hypothetical protein